MWDQFTPPEGHYTAVSGAFSAVCIITEAPLSTSATTHQHWTPSRSLTALYQEKRQAFIHQKVAVNMSCEELYRSLQRGMQFLQLYLLKGEPQYANVSVREGLHTVARPQGDSVYCPGPVMEHPTLLLSLKYQNSLVLQLQHRQKTDQYDRTTWSRPVTGDIHLGLPSLQGLPDLVLSYTV